MQALKKQLCRHCFPDIIRTDNGPQYTSRELSTFCKTHDITHETSSPHYSQSNGEAERAVRTVKNLWKKCDDKQLALLQYRNTPLESCNRSPAQPLMSRQLLDNMARVKSNLMPEARYLLQSDKQRQKSVYDRKASHELPTLDAGGRVLIQADKGSSVSLPSIVVEKVAPRSYLVKYRGSMYRRNRKHIRKCVDQTGTTNDIEHRKWRQGAEYQRPVPVETESGRIVTTPDRLGISA